MTIDKNEPSPLTEAARALGRKGGGRKTDAQRAELDAGRNGYNAARTAANVARARAWLNERPNPNKDFTRRATVKAFERLPTRYIKQYAALHDLHPRTAARHLLAALNEENKP